MYSFSWLIDCERPHLCRNWLGTQVTLIPNLNTISPMIHLPNSKFRMTFYYAEFILFLIRTILINLFYMLSRYLNTPFKLNGCFVTIVALIMSVIWYSPPGQLFWVSISLIFCAIRDRLCFILPVISKSSLL